MHRATKRGRPQQPLTQWCTRARGLPSGYAHSRSSSIRARIHLTASSRVAAGWSSCHSISALVASPTARPFGTPRCMSSLPLIRGVMFHASSSPCSTMACATVAYAAMREAVTSWSRHMRTSSAMGLGPSGARRVTRSSWRQARQCCPALRMARPISRREGSRAGLPRGRPVSVARCVTVSARLPMSLECACILRMAVTSCAVMPLSPCLMMSSARDLNLGTGAFRLFTPAGCAPGAATGASLSGARTVASQRRLRSPLSSCTSRICLPRLSMAAFWPARAARRCAATSAAGSRPSATRPCPSQRSAWRTSREPVAERKRLAASCARAARSAAPSRATPEDASAEERESARKTASCKRSSCRSRNARTGAAPAAPTMEQTSRSTRSREILVASWACTPVSDMASRRAGATL
mmetsp:Transcript_8660/g.23808  ORF Transcript_8660/g.23808 Transcript_8660/m.23808 type:complete len:411 (+) Transcript_8660:279-1511(+)